MFEIVLPCFRRRGNTTTNHHRATSSHSSSSTTESSSFDSSDDDLDSATDEEIRAIEQRDNNPFHSLQIPRIVVQSNSPLPTLTAAANITTRRGQAPPPDLVMPQYVAQRVPLNPPALPLGTALYRPRYQHYRTPDLTAGVQPQLQLHSSAGSQYRPASAVSNSLKKKWVVPAVANGGAGAASSGSQPQQRRVDQSEIDARLKSLMDRLSSQQVSECF